MYAIGPGGQRGLQIVPRHSISLSHVNVPHVPLFLSPGQLETRCIPSTHHQYSRRSSLAVVTAATGPNSDENSNFGGGKWEGQGVGPEGLEDDPVLHDLLMGMGASGAKSAGEKPAGAPGMHNTNIYTEGTTFLTLRPSYFLSFLVCLPFKRPYDYVARRRGVLCSNQEHCIVSYL